MTETKLANYIEKRCRNCAYSTEYIAFIAGRDDINGPHDTQWYLQEPRNIGQTRNCFSRLQQFWNPRPRFIYPNDKDECINIKKFKPKST